MQMVRDEVPAPPVGFRRAIPTSVKLDVIIRQEGRCRACGEKLGTLSDTQFDHVPAIQLRAWNANAGDTIPAANDAEHIEAKHKDCHAQKTTGRKGESKLNAIGGDTASIAKLRRLTAKEQEFRKRMLAKAAGEEIEEKPKKKHQWPKRKLGAQNGSQRARAKENDQNPYGDRWG